MNFLKLHKLPNINWPRPNQLGLTWNSKLVKSKRQNQLLIKNIEKKAIKKEQSTFIVACYSVLHRMAVIGHAHCSWFMEWHNLGITVSTFIVACYSVLHRMAVIGHAHCSWFMEWHNLGITVQYLILWQYLK